jgi:hypothetical protein
MTRWVEDVWIDRFLPRRGVEKQKQTNRPELVTKDVQKGQIHHQTARKEPKRDERVKTNTKRYWLHLQLIDGLTKKN